MALDKASKEILLYGGVDNDKHEHLQSAPNVAYIENGHWRNKEGIIQKRFGLIPATVAGGPSALTSPRVLHSQGDSLYTFLAGKSYQYNIEKDEWSNQDQVRFFTENERFASSTRNATLHGSAFYYSKDRSVATVNDYKIFAWGTDERTSQVAVYDDSDQLVREFSLTGAFPKIVPNETDGVYIFTAQNLVLGLLYVTVVDLLDGSNTPESLIASDLYFGKSIDPADNTGQADNSFDFLDTPFNRAMAIGGNRPYFCVTSPQDTSAYHQQTTDQSLLAYQDTLGNMKVRHIKSGTTTTIGTTLDANKPLAIWADEQVSNRVFIITNEHAYAAGPVSEDNINKVASYTVSGAGTLSGGTADFLETILHSWGPLGTDDPRTRDEVGHALRATLAQNGTQLLVAVAYRDNRVALYDMTTTTSGATIPADRNLDGHTICTNMIYAAPTGGVGQFYVGLQQFTIPRQTYASSGVDTGAANPASSFASLRFPSTSCLVNLTADPANEAPSVVAAFDVNQSKVTDFTDYYSDIHLEWLQFGPDDTFYFTNREVFTFVGASGQGNLTGGHTSKQLGSDARFNVYRATVSQTARVPGVGLGDGLIIPGGATMWWDGQMLAELSPLGPPQIANIRPSAILADTQAREVSQTVFLCDEIRTTLDTFSGRVGTGNWRGVQAVVGYTDKNGNVHRSATSPLIYAGHLAPSADSSDAWSAFTHGSDARIYIDVPLTMNPTQMGDAKYFVEVYVSDTETGPPKLAAKQNFTPNGEQVLVVVNNNAFSNDTGNDPTVGTNYTENQTGPMVRVTPPIYTTGGVLAADTWPSITYGVATSTRIFALSAEDSGQVYYSKSFRELVSPEFSAALVLSLGDARKLTAIGRLDDKVVVFERNEIHVIYGPGPDDTGTTGRAGGFDIHNITSDVGCDQPSSLVEVPNGLIFKAQRGFYLLDRSSKLHFIGAPVYDMSYNATVKSACIVPEWAEVRFLMDDRDAGTFVPEFGPTKGRTRPAETRYARELPLGACLVYNYEMNRWSVFSGYDGDVCSLDSNGRFVKIRSDWSVHLEARPEDDYYDSSLIIETPWTPAADDLQGLARVRRVTVNGKYMTSQSLNRDGVMQSNDLKTEVFYDYEEPEAAGLTVESHEWRGNVELLDYPTAVPLRMQTRFKPGRQKCQAIKFRISDSISTPHWITGEPDVSAPDPATFAHGRGFEISSINMDLGIKQGPVRSLPAKRKS